MNRSRLVFIFLYSFTLSLTAWSQPYFRWNDSIKVKTEVDFIANPWAGGLNFVQTSNIDLDLDGVKDIFTFDRTGNTIRTFIKTGAPGTTSYRYAPWYETRFPVILDWVLLADYNCDGKEDIFCYSTKQGGFDVYKNTSTPSTGLQFQKVVTQQLSVYFPDANANHPCGPAKPCNLYVSAVDIPAISDIDNDGDLDVVTFDINSGSYMIYHKNMSKEKYGTCDSLVFQVANHCWGFARENALNNSFTLRDTCIINVLHPEFIPGNTDKPRHSGSSEICIDLDGDGDKEFIVGDISFNSLTMLTNGGTPTKANFVKIDTAFPASKPVDMTIFPCPFYVDADNDGIKDLIVSPNAPNACENFNSMAFYKNTGTNNFPNFEYKQGNFLQDQMIELGEGAYPTLFDYNKDGLLDLFIGNYGYYGKPSFISKVACFKNTGTSTNPQFELVTWDYGNLSSFNLPSMVPAFGDLDGDGDADLIIGDYGGYLNYFQNTASPGMEPQFVLTQGKLKYNNPKNKSIDVGDFATPQIIDVDQDGKNDLIIGAKNGKLAYYRNTGVVNNQVPAFDSISHFWGHVNVLHAGNIQACSYPFLFKDNSATKLLVGNQDGYLYLYDHIDNNINGTFTVVDTMYERIHQGARSAPCGADVTNDGYIDMFLGNYQGGIAFYKGNSKSNIGLDSYDGLIHFNFELFPNPANNNVTIRINFEHRKTYQVEIYNLMGQQIDHHVITDNLLTMDTGNLQAGMYLYKVYEIDSAQNRLSGALTKRLIIQH